jgi:hypothetical protein
MRLTDVRLFLSNDEFPRELRSEFLFRSCYVSHYVTRRVRELRLPRDYKGLLVRGCLLGGEPRISVEGNLIVPVEFSSARYMSLRPGEEHKFFVEMLADGLARTAEGYRVPVVEMKAILDDFREGGYRNEWTHQKKNLRAIGVQSSLLCSLDPEHFWLVLRLEKKGVVVFEQQILETKPDEVIFAHRFKDVVLDNDAIIVVDKFGKPLFSPPSASWR